MDYFVKHSGLNITGLSLTTLSGHPAYKMDVDMDGQKMSQISTIGNNLKYDISYPVGKWASNSTIQAMLGSFEIIKSKTADKTLPNNTLGSNELG